MESRTERRRAHAWLRRSPMHPIYPRHTCMSTPGERESSHGIERVWVRSRTWHDVRSNGFYRGRVRSLTTEGSCETVSRSNGHERGIAPQVIRSFIVWYFFFYFFFSFLFSFLLCIFLFIEFTLVFIFICQFSFLFFHCVLFSFHFCRFQLNFVVVIFSFSHMFLVFSLYLL